jgi:hypothetical protein
MKKVNCPMCLNSSGFVIFTGRYNQICDCCSGRGLISIIKYNKIKKIYGGLIR